MLDMNDLLVIVCCLREIQVRNKHYQQRGLISKEYMIIENYNCQRVIDKITDILLEY